MSASLDFDLHLYLALATGKATNHLEWQVNHFNAPRQNTCLRVIVHVYDLVCAT